MQHDSSPTDAKGTKWVTQTCRKKTSDYTLLICSFSIIIAVTGQLEDAVYWYRGTVWIHMWGGVRKIKSVAPCSSPVRLTRPAWSPGAISVFSGPSSLQAREWSREVDPSPKRGRLSFFFFLEETLRWKVKVLAALHLLRDAAAFWTAQMCVCSELQEND